MHDFMTLVAAIVIGGLFVVATVGWSVIVWWKFCVKHLVESLVASQEAVERKEAETFKEK